MEKFEIIITTLFGLESLVAREVRRLGYETTSVEDGRVTFMGDNEAVCRANMWIRTGERVLIKTAEFTAVTFDELFEKTKAERERVERQYAPKIKASSVTSFRHHYDVVGESFDNEDGTSRQEILGAIANCEPPYEDCEVSLDEFDYKGERALAVKVNGDQIGCIAKENLDAVFNDLEFTDAITLKVFGGENGKSYGAAITLIANADE